MTRKEKVLGFIRQNMKIPMTAEEIMLMLSVPKEDIPEFTAILEELEQEGRILKTKKGRYTSASAA